MQVVKNIATRDDVIFLVIYSVIHYSGAALDNVCSGLHPCMYLMGLEVHPHSCNHSLRKSKST